MQPCDERFVGSRHEPLGIEAEELAQAVALEAHALRAVEAEQLRRRLLEAEAAIGAGEVGGEDDVAGLRAGAARSVRASRAVLAASRTIVRLVGSRTARLAPRCSLPHPAPQR